MRTLMILTLAATLLCCAACEDEKKSEESEESEESASSELPDATITVDLSEWGMPLTVEVPEGTIAMEDLGGVRLDHESGDPGPPGLHFGVQIRPASADESMADIKASLLEYAGSRTYTFTEESDTLLVWTSESDGYTEENFRMRLEVGGELYECGEGVYGGWTAEHIERQMAACETLAAK